MGTITEVKRMIFHVNWTRIWMIFEDKSKKIEKNEKKMKISSGCTAIWYNLLFSLQVKT